MKVVACYNPRARGGRFQREMPRLRALLEEHSVDATLLEICDTDFNETLCRKLESETFDAVVGIGGDGTHFHLVNTLLRFGKSHPERPQPRYVFLPFGTGNNIAKSLRLKLGPRSLPTAIANLTDGIDKKLDLGTWSGYYFVDALSVGLDARILHFRNQMSERLQKHVMRRLVHAYIIYALATVRAMFSKHRFRMEILVDGKRWYEGSVADVIVNNTRIYGGEFDLTPECRTDDGLLDIALIRSRVEYVYRFVFAYRHLPSFLRRLFVSNHSGNAWTQGRHVEMLVADPVPVQVDGELFPNSSTFRIGVADGAVTVKVGTGGA